MATTASAPRAERRLLPALLLAAGVALAFAGGSRLLPALHRLPVDSVLGDLGRGRAVAPDQIREARELLLSDARQPAADLKDRGRLTIEAALQGSSGADDTAAELQKAWQDLQDGLAAAPSDPYGWLRLSHVELLLHGFTPLARAALERSLAQSTNYGPLMAAQLDFGLLLWPILTPAMRDDLMERVPGIGTWDIRELAAIAYRRSAAPRLETALAHDPKRLASFRYFYGRAAAGG